MPFDKDALLFDLITRDAVLVWNDGIFRLDGPFENRDDATAAADLLKQRLSEIVDDSLQAVSRSNAA